MKSAKVYNRLRQGDTTWQRYLVSNAKAQVCPREGNSRPVIMLEKTTHPLAVDFYKGINIGRAQEIAEAVMHRGQTGQS